MVKTLRCVWLLALCCYFTSTVLTSPSTRKYGGPEIKISSPAHFREMKEMIPYEASAKLIVKIPLPVFPPIPVPTKQKILYQMAYDTIQIFLEDYRTYIKGLRNGQREKRQLIVGIAGATIGYLVHSIYTRITSKIAGSETEAVAHVDQLWQALRLHKKEFLFFETRVGEYSRNLTSTFAKLALHANDYELAQIASLHLQQLEIVVGKIYRGLNMCLHNNIPVELIGVKHLETSIETVEKNITQYGYKLAINPKQITRLERLNVADCFITQETMYVLINIPVVKYDWKVFQLLPVPFAFHSQTCVLSPHDPDIVVISSDKIKVIDKYMLTFCDFRRDFLCLVPDLMPKEHNSGCAKYLYNGEASIDNIVTSPCKYECKDSVDPSVIQIEKNKITAANVKSLSVQCPTKKISVKTPDIGSLEITVLCRCQYNLDGYIINGDTICVHETVSSMSTEDIVHVLPDFLVNTAAALKSDAILKDWPKHIPVLNYTPAVPVPILENYAGPVQYRDWVLLFMIGVVVVMTVFNIIICHCWRKLKIST